MKDPIKLTDEQQATLSLRIARDLMKDFNKIYNKELAKLHIDKNTKMDAESYINLFLNCLNKFNICIMLNIRDLYKKYNNMELNMNNLVATFHMGMNEDLDKIMKKVGLN